MKSLKFKKIILIPPLIITLSSIFVFFYLINSKPKVILIGLDGASWNIMAPLIKKGKLPHIKMLIDKGAFGSLESIVPMISPSLWTSIATGKNFEKHGITSFVIIPEGLKDPVPVTSNLRKTKAIWNILTERRKKSIIINYYVTYPPEKINGKMISRLDYTPEYSSRKGLPLKEQLNYPYQVYPRSIEPKVSNLVAQTVKDLDFNKVYKELADLFILEKITLNFITENWDFFTVYTRSADEAEHLYWKYMEPEKFKDKRWGKITDSDIKRYGRIIEEIYMEADKFIGWILTKIDKNTTLFIVSDHGMKAASEFDPRNPMDSGIHDIEGVIIISGKNIKAKHLIKNASVLDITPTILYLLDLPVGKDMDGKVLIEVLNPAYRSLHRIEYIKTYDTGWEKGKKEEPIRSPFDKEIIDRLKSLGYLH